MSDRPPLLVETIRQIRERVRADRAAGLSVGFVPTMGALHAGHASLIGRSVAENDRTVVSIFVNPTQFGPGEDFELYPRTLEEDMERCREAGAGAGVGIVFAPGVEEMYAGDAVTQVKVDRITRPLCGRTRPGHFDGVATVVTKLFHIVPAHRAYFGQKDAQQVLVIRRMVRDLCMDIEVVSCPIVREPDGLALSSRNVYLEEPERRAALCLQAGLKAVETAFSGGETRVSRLRGLLIGPVEAEPLARLDYGQILDATDLSPLETVDRPALAALAAHIGTTRLIDNTVLRKV